jgi:predicted CXXCH cytochrome family protein
VHVSKSTRATFSVLFSFRVLCALLVLGAASATWILAAQHDGFHPANMPCEACHLAGNSVRPEQAHLLIATQEKLCATCHQNLAQVSHPSGFPPRTKLHADYPADWKGDLTCSTCHEVHGKTPGIMRGKRRGRELCLACHDAQFFAHMRDQGNSMTGSGHLEAGNAMADTRLDSYSRQCMACHGAKGDGDAPSVDRNMIVRHGATSLNHPIGANYAKAMKFGGYRKISQISKKILLPGGLVSCVSCHEGYSKTHGKLVIPRAKSALCFECHDL